MSKRLAKNFKQIVIQYARKLILPVSMMVLGLVPHCVQAYTVEPNEWKNVQIYGGGMITGITFSEAEKNLIYARTDMGGVYRWQEDSQSWKPLTDWVGPDMWSNLGCEAIAADPTDSKRVYTLMGEYSNSWTNINGAVFCSDDKGETWKVSMLPFKCASNMQGRLMGSRLVVDPNKNSRLWLGSRENGLWKSEDYGKTWKQVTSFPTVGDAKFDANEEWGGSVGITMIQVDKNSAKGNEGSQTIYVGVGNHAHSMYRSKDGGKTWEPLPNEPRGIVTNKETGATAYRDNETLMPYQSYLTKNGMLYITYSTQAGPYDSGKGDLWRFDTNTDEWKLMSPVCSINSDNSDPAFAYQGLVVDPNNEDTIMTICHSWWPDISLYRTTDGGENWTNIWSWEGYPKRNLKYNMDISASPWLDWGKSHGPNDNAEASPKLGWTVGAIGLDPFNSDRLFYGTGATMYGTDNLTNWDKPNGKIDITVKAKGIEETVSNALITIPDTKDDGLVTSLFDITGFYHSDVTKVPQKISGASTGNSNTVGNSTDLDYAELNPKIVVRVGGRTKLDNYGSYLNGMSWSTDGGVTFAPIYSRIGNSEGKGQVALAADGKVVVWAPEDEKPSWSLGGYNWTTCQNLPQGATICSDRVNPNMFYGYSNGKVYVSTDGAKTFQTVEVPGLPAESMNMKAVRGHEGHVWLGTAKADKKSGLWYSEDGGKTFTKVPNVDEALSFGFGKAHDEDGYPAIYMVGKVEGQDGFFRSDDEGQNWTRINDDQHQYGLVDAGCDVTGDYDVYGRVYIGTNGRGVVYADTGASAVVEKNATLSQKEATFDKKEDLQKDITVGIKANGHKLNALKVNDTVLILGKDYTVNNDQVTISKSFLAEQSEGKLEITFDFDGGKDPVLAVRITKSAEDVKNAEITTKEATFDKNTATQQDIQLDANFNGNTLTVVTDGNKILTNKDCSVQGNKIIISKDFLNQYAKGSYTLTFKFDKGADQTVRINVVDTTQEKPPIVEPTGGVELNLKSGNDANSNTITSVFKLSVTDDSTYDLSQIKIRYYFTAEDASLKQNQWIDNSAVQYKHDPWYRSVGNESTAQVYQVPGGLENERYLEITFTGDNKLDKGSVLEVATRIANENWTNFDQTNDYSYNNASHVEVYYKDQLICGQPYSAK